MMTSKALVCLALGLAAAGLRAQVSPIGSEFQVNSYTTNDQSIPALAVDGPGNFVVTWTSAGSSGTDRSAQSVQAQRYAADGAALGPEFQINSYTINIQANTDVALDAQGNFVVAWGSYGSTGTDHRVWSVQAQRYGANGAPLGGQFQVNTYTWDSQLLPAVAMNGQGNFVVAWESRGSNGTDSDGFSIQAQRFDSSGAPIGGEFQVNSYTTGNQLTPAIDMDAEGKFVVAWQSYGSSSRDTSYGSIQLQRFDAYGLPLGGQVEVNTWTTGGQTSPAIVVESQGSFVVVWDSGGLVPGPDGSESSIEGRRYDAGGAPLGDELQINSYTSGTQRYPDVAMGAQGELVVTWESFGSSGSDRSGYSIHAQLYGADGSALGGQFQVNSYTRNAQYMSTVGMDGQGNFVVAWQSTGSSGTDTSLKSIQAQRFRVAFFWDGFETGDTSRWSTFVP